MGALTLITSDPSWDAAEFHGMPWIFHGNSVPWEIMGTRENPVASRDMHLGSHRDPWKFQRGTWHGALLSGPPEHVLPVAVDHRVR